MGPAFDWDRAGPRFQSCWKMIHSSRLSHENVVFFVVMGRSDAHSLDSERGSSAVSELVAPDVDIEEHAREVPASKTSNDARITQMVREHYAFVWRSLLRLGVPARMAEDAAQQVF